MSTMRLLPKVVLIRTCGWPSVTYDPSLDAVGMRAHGVEHPAGSILRDRGSERAFAGEVENVEPQVGLIVCRSVEPLP